MNSALHATIKTCPLFHIDHFSSFLCNMPLWSNWGICPHISSNLLFPFSGTQPHWISAGGKVAQDLEWDGRTDGRIEKDEEALAVIVAPSSARCARASGWMRAVKRIRAGGRVRRWSLAIKCLALKGPLACFVRVLYSVRNSSLRLSLRSSSSLQRIM